jgi:hypothetical protein
MPPEVYLTGDQDPSAAGRPVVCHGVFHGATTVKLAAAWSA